MKHPMITVDPETMLGKPVILGTRFPVEHILRRLSEGMTPEELVSAYRVLTPEAIRAAQAYAADVIACEDIEYAERKTA